MKNLLLIVLCVVISACAAPASTLAPTSAPVPTQIPSPPPTPTPLRSIVSSIKVDLNFVNLTNRRVEIDWIDPDGKEVKYFDLEPSKSKIQGTFAGHAWRAKDVSTGKIVSEFIVAADSKVFNIKD